MSRLLLVGMALALLPFAEDSTAQTLYKQVDEKGKTTYTDRPPQVGGEEVADRTSVADPEARRQLYEEQCGNRQAKRDPREREVLKGHERREVDRAAVADCTNRREAASERRR